MKAGFSVRRRQRAESEAAERLARAVTLDALDGALTFARREQLAERLTDDEAALLAGLVSSNRSPHSLRALAGDLEHLSLWCRAETGTALPLPPDEALVLRFLASQRAAAPCPSPSTLRRRIVSWAALTRAADGDTQMFSAPAIRETLGGPPARHRPSRPLDATEFKRVLATCEGDGLTGCRDRALLLAAALLSLRPAEIAALSVEDARCERWPPPLRQAMTQWTRQAGLTSGPLFRPVDRWGKPGRLGLTPQSVRLVVRARALAAGLDPEGLTARSLR